MNENHQPHRLVAVPQPDGPSAKNARRAGSPNHQRNTSEEMSMVEPIPSAADLLGMVTSYAARYAEASDQLQAEHERAVAALLAEAPVAPVVPLRGWRR